MSLKKSADQIILHDSVVNKYTYNSDDKRLCLLLELCNFMQPWYKEGEPENLCGQFVFSGVRKRRSEPEVAFVDWNNADGQILDISLTPNKRGEYEVEMVLEISDYVRHSEDIFVARFEAENFEWISELSDVIVNQNLVAA